MLDDIPAAMRSRMAELEALDRAQRAGAAPPARWLRTVDREAGRLITVLAGCAPRAGTFVELGTGSGYSTLWLLLALRERAPRPRLVTIERDADKASLARVTFERCAVTELVEQRVGDAASELRTLGPLAFAFMDHGPSNYEACRDGLVTALVPGGLLAVDNVDSHRRLAARFMRRLAADPRVETCVLHVGKGILLARRRR
ncbi:class I SAM-dependent methyltransferase [Candidatus Binatia bacterium]|nr:class I SAM-dependent methyltransferase [Candidatus Binatia bacterium]